VTVAQAETTSQGTNASILIIDDDAIILDSLTQFLGLEGYRVNTACDFDAASEVLSTGGVQIVITDLNMPDHNGLEVLRIIRQYHPDVVPIVITGYGSISSAVEAVKLGAYDYLTKPIVDDELRIAIERALKQQSLQAENIVLKERLSRQEQFGELVGRDHRMQKMFDLIETVAGTSTTVLITGESGTGKSMVARAIHRASHRKDQPFVEVSCGALPESLLESELFGHVKGAFTGALADKEGRFLAAEGGTIFLDEIDSAPAALQVKLLRVLQERQFEPVGTNKTVTVDVRVIAATNKDLKTLVKRGEFREDLYYRIKVVGIHLPPLRERLSDIRFLANHFLEKFRSVRQKPIEKIAAETFDLLERYGWPGNVRELENAIERAVVLAGRDVIMPDDLPAELTERRSDHSRGWGEQNEAITLAQGILQAEREIISSTLERFGWNRKRTAEALAISRTSLFRKMRRLGILDQADNDE